MKLLPYGIALIVLIVAIAGFMMYRKREGFQNVAGGTTVKLSKESCVPLKSQIDQYKRVRQENKDVMIVDLDTTIEKLENYYTTYGCGT